MLVPLLQTNSLDLQQGETIKKEKWQGCKARGSCGKYVYYDGDVRIFKGGVYITNTEM
jgi:hypothetical protein